MILTSCPAVSWPRSSDAAMMRTANSTMLYSTLSRTDSLKTLAAMRSTVGTETRPLIGRLPSRRPAARTGPSRPPDRPDARTDPRACRAAGVIDTRRPPRPPSSRARRSGSSVGSASTAYRPGAMVGDGADARMRRRRRCDTPSRMISQPLSCAVTRSVSVPDAISRPLTTMAMRLQSVSASDRMCELKKTVRPSSRSRRISARTSRRPRGSRPDIGSSRKITSGSLISAWASPTR